MPSLIVAIFIVFVMFQNVNGSRRCTCICCRGMDCSPVKQPPFLVDSCDIDNKCNSFCCQRYTQVCFPLPGPGVVDSICENLTIDNF